MPKSETKKKNDGKSKKVHMDSKKGLIAFNDPKWVDIMKLKDEKLHTWLNGHEKSTLEDAINMLKMKMKEFSIDLTRYPRVCEALQVQAVSTK